MMRLEFCIFFALSLGFTLVFDTNYRISNPIPTIGFQIRHQLSDFKSDTNYRISNPTLTIGFQIRHQLSDFKSDTNYRISNPTPTIGFQIDRKSVV